MTRRELIAEVGALVIAGTPRQTVRPPSPRLVPTVTGPLGAQHLGLTLMHEHLLVDFIGADQVSPSRYDANQAFSVILPHLAKARAAGCETLVDCTPAYLGRDVRLLMRLSGASGVNILTNTGYYGAAKDKHLPRHAFTESTAQLAARWTREFDRGIDGTDIKPAFMKIGVDEAPLSEVDAKLVRAAALTARATGLPIASHTSTGAAAMAEIDLLDRAGVPAGAFIWVHAHNERDTTLHTRAARAGAWVEFDGVSDAGMDRHVELVRQMKAQGLLDRVLVSQDAGWYHVGEPGGGQFRSFDTLFTTFIPALTNAGLTKEDVRRLLIENPRRALTREGRPA
jgi:predicted metal-dependent phosphotriesterase family hydrolase